MKTIAILTLALAAAPDVAAAQVDRCPEDRFVHGTWIEPGLQEGAFQAALLDATGAVAYLLDAELTRFVSAGDVGRPPAGESGGVYGQLTAVAGGLDGVSVVGHWSRDATGIGSFTGVLVRAGEPPLGVLTGQFGIEDALLDLADQPVPELRQPDLDGATASAQIVSAAARFGGLARDLGGRLREATGAVPPTIDGGGGPATDDGPLPRLDKATCSGGGCGGQGGTRTLSAVDASRRARELSGHDGPDQLDEGDDALDAIGVDSPSAHGGGGGPAQRLRRALRFDGAAHDARGDRLPALDQGVLIGSWGTCLQAR